MYLSTRVTGAMPGNVVSLDIITQPLDLLVFIIEEDLPMLN